MANGQETDRALMDIEAKLSSGRATDVMALADEIMRVQQDLADRLGNLEAEM